MAKTDLTAQRLRELLHYDPATGVFTWRVGFARVQPGEVAGHVGANGYRFIKIAQSKWHAHRLAFLYMTGQHPPDEVDHRNKDRQDNRWDNLRPATHKQNHENRTTHEMRGIRWEADRMKWLVRIKSNGLTKNLGRYTSLDQAVAVRRVAERIYFTHSPVCEPQA